MPSISTSRQQTGTYTWTEARVDYSGTSATAYFYFGRTNNYAATPTGGDQGYASAGGVTIGPFAKYFTGYTDYGLVATVNFTISITGGTYNLSVTGLGYLDHSGSVNIPSQAVAPAVPTATVNSKTDSSVTFNVSLSSYGTPSSASGRYIEAALSATKAYCGATRRYASAAEVTSATITVNNSSAGNLNIVGNTLYYYGAYANNTSETSMTADAEMKTVVTLPSSPVATDFTVIDAGTASFNITETSVGSQRSIQLYYRYGTGPTITGGWHAAGSPGNHQTEAVVLTGLDSNTSYKVQVMADASGEESAIAEYTNAFTTDKVTVSITSETDEMSGDIAWHSAYFSMSAVSTPSTNYEVEYSYKKASVSTWTTQTQTSTTSNDTITFAVSRNTTYNLRIRARIAGGIDEEWGDYATSTFTVPTFGPNMPTVSYTINEVRDSIAISIEASEDEEFSSMTYSVYGGGSYLVPETTISTTSESFSLDLPDPSSVSSLEIRAYQTNSFNIDSNVRTVAVPVLRHILGTIVLADGTRKNIVGIKFKNTSGTVSDGDYTHPFITK